MAPKKPKEPMDDENSWRRIIEEAKLNEDNWQVKVTMMEPAGSDQDRIYLSKFETFAIGEKRFVIKNICKTETIFMINQLGGEKKTKDETLRVFEEAQDFLKEKKDIPTEYIALVIKHLIVKMKDENLYIKRQRLQVRDGIHAESLTMIEKAEVRGTANVKPPEPPAPPPSAITPKKGKNEPVEPVPDVDPDEDKKYNTLLRVRGEEWRDKVYVDDFPTDGPNLYVAVTGFTDPALPAALIKLGIPLAAIVQVRIDPTVGPIPSTLFRGTKRGQSQTELFADKALKFWEDIQMLRINKDTADDFKGTACIIFTPPYWDSDNLSGDPDKIYDELCFLMYDVQDLTRQHVHYLNNIDTISIPEEEEELRYVDHYHKLIDDLPLECITAFSVLDSILHTVCKVEHSLTASIVSAFDPNPNAAGLHPSTTDYKVEKSENLVKQIFNTLCNTEVDKKTYRLTYGEEFESHTDPVVIRYGDIAKYNTFHLGNINIDKIVWSSLLHMPLNNLFKNQKRPEGEMEAKVNFHVNLLLSCFEREDIETAELNRLIHILACRKLYNNRSSLKKSHLSPSTLSDFKKTYLKRSILAEPLLKCPSMGSAMRSNAVPSFPSMTRSENIFGGFSQKDVDEEDISRIRMLFDCPDISELVSAVEIANRKPMEHLIDDFDYFEDFSGICAFQRLYDMFNHFNCVDYKYCEVTDCFLLMFYNSHDNDGISRNEWRCHLATPLCLQDFFDYVLDECYDWIQNEEKIYDNKFDIKLVACSRIFQSSFVNLCVEDTNVDADLLMEGSLKYNELHHDDMDEMDPDATATTNTTADSPSVTLASDTKSSKKGKPLTVSTPKVEKSRPAQGDGLSEVSVTKPFFGYNLGDRRVEVFGKDSTYFSKDGTRVTTMYTLLIPMNVEYIILNVVPGDHCNNFWVHKALGEGISPNILDLCESFRITNKDDVMINIKKQQYKVPLPVMSTTEMDKTKQKDDLINYSVIETIFESKVYYSFTVTWPNGLITESVHVNNSPEISHIKQFHINPMPDLKEDMRCISLNGEVIIFRPSGKIEVLKPDGGYILITNVYKQVIVPPEPEDVVVEVVDKGKKGAKPVKSKASKVSSKSSKAVIEEEIKPLEYELICEEFETIDASGIRQQWTNEVPQYIERLLIRTATDYCLGEVFSRRMDGTHILLNKDGLQIVTFPNKTRIITKYYIEEEEIFPDWTDEEKELFMMGPDSVEFTEQKSYGSHKSNNEFSVSAASFSSKKEELEDEEKMKSEGYLSVQLIFTIEHSNLTTVIIDKGTGKISIESPSDTVLEMTPDNQYHIILDKLTAATFDGERLKFEYEACPECRSFTTGNIKITSNDFSSVTRIQDYWMKMKDSFCKKIVVNEEGTITLSDECSQELLIHAEEGIADESNDNNEAQSDKTESSVLHGKCREMYLAKKYRFFVLNRDLKCSELLHRALLHQYQADNRWQPWYSSNTYNTFGDNRNLLSILVPVQTTQTEKWIMDSKLADKPKHMTFQDLKEDAGKGFYHWMRPYARFKPKPIKPAIVMLPRLPRAYILRILELQWKEPVREQLRGAKELVRAILRYRHIVESDSETLMHVPLLDTRSEDEQKVDDVIQAIAHKMYSELAASLEEDVQLHSKPDITTQPPAPEQGGEGEETEKLGTSLSDVLHRSLEEERASQLHQMESREGMSAKLKRYWRTRAEEKKEELFYLYLLRDGNVPQYFRNVLGGAIWWEMNNTASEAVDKSERRKMKCDCDDDTEQTPQELQGFVYDV